MTHNMDKDNFKAIICGGGPVGLVMAHALSKANIDFIVLEEQPVVVRFAGAGLNLFPHAQRALDQLGILQALEPMNVVKDMIDVTGSGSALRRYDIFGMLTGNFGYETAFISRGEILEALYTALPEHDTRVRTGASVVDVETDANGVRVHLKDGSTVEGSVVIGCDGCHSKTRAAMVKLLREAGEDIAEFSTTPEYYGIFGRVDNPRGIPAGTCSESRDTGWACQIFGGEEVAYFAAMRTISDHSAVRRRYTELERDAFARDAAHFFVQPDLTFGELWAQTDKASAVLVNQEQAYLDRWHYGRIVMVGDSHVKISSITGQGFAIGALSAVQLANELHSILASGQRQPSLASLEEAFAKYQKAREKPCAGTSKLSAEIMKRLTWSSWSLWFMDRWVMSWLDLVGRTRDRMRPVLADSPILGFVPFEGKAGITPWRQLPNSKA